MKKILGMISTLCVSALIWGCSTPTETKVPVEPTPTPTVALLPSLLEDFDRTATIEETVLYDENQVKVVAKSIVFTEDDMILTVDLTNNASCEVGFSCGSGACDVNSINGVMAEDGFISIDVAAGTTTEAKIKFSIDYMVATGFSCVADFEIGFWISGDDIKNFYTGPLGITTSSVNDYDYTVNTYQEIINDKTFEKAYECEVIHFSTDEIYSNEVGTIRVISCAIIKTTNGKFVAQFEIENMSGSKVQAWGKESHINGEMVKSYSAWIESINNGKILIASFPLTDYAKGYSGEADVSILREFSFTLCIGETSNYAKESAKISVGVPDIKLITE